MRWRHSWGGERVDVGSRVCQGEAVAAQGNRYPALTLKRQEGQRQQQQLLDCRHPDRRTETAGGSQRCQNTNTHTSERETQDRSIQQLFQLAGQNIRRQKITSLGEEETLFRSCWDSGCGPGVFLFFSSFFFKGLEGWVFFLLIWSS